MLTEMPNIMISQKNPSGSLFMRTIDSFAPHNEAIWRPPESHQLDYEGECSSDW